jgi:hypothetical protein
VEPGFPPGSRDQRKNRERPRRRDGSDYVETALAFDSGLPIVAIHRKETPIMGGDTDADWAAYFAEQQTRYARELPGISLEQVRTLIELEHFTDDAAAKQAGLNTLLDDLRNLVQPAENEFLEQADRTFNLARLNSRWSELYDVVDLMRRTSRDVRRSAIGLTQHPHILREHLKMEVSIAEAVERMEAILDALDN